MTFQPGKSGNPSGVAKLKQLTNDLRKVVAQNPAKVRKISEHILEQAEAGDLTYIQFLYDRLDGKAAQTLEIDQTVTHEMADHVNLLRELKKRHRDRSATDVTPVQTNALVKR